MSAKNILHEPLISEKMTELSERLNDFGFIVDRKASKLSIKKAVEEMYKVKVESVRTMTIPGKARQRFTKQGIIRGQSPAYKKAIVKLVEGDNIDFFSNV